MSDLEEKISLEIMNIKEALQELSGCGPLTDLPKIELAGVAVYIHNFYNGIENILKQIFKSERWRLPDSYNWHNELLRSAEKNKVLTVATRTRLQKYLSFRHYFIHSYAFSIKPEKMKELLDDIKPTFNAFQKNINTFQRRR